MKYTDQKSRTVWEDVEVEVPDGVTYFHSFNTDGEPEDYYKLNIKQDLRFDILYNIAITKIRNYDDDFSIRWWEVCEAELPYNLRGYFSGQEKKEIITEEEFNKVKTEVLSKL